MRRDGEVPSEGGEELLALHEAVGMIVDLEQELMDSHLKAIQVSFAWCFKCVGRRVGVLFFATLTHTHANYFNTHTPPHSTPPPLLTYRKMLNC